MPPESESNSQRSTLSSNIDRVRQAALDTSPISGLTHRFYRYPARFSPQFAGAAIDAFSRPGQLVLDPYMGGGTTVVEAMVRGRKVVGCDLNSLAVFIGRAKTTLLSDSDAKSLRTWADETIPALSYTSTPDDLSTFTLDPRTKNLTLPNARPIKKVLALALRSLAGYSDRSTIIARCALLNAGQWALNGKTAQPNLRDFREFLRRTVHDMVDSVDTLRCATDSHSSPPALINDTAVNLEHHEPFSSGARATLAVASPPYPGIHVLYHRWQVDGRRESPAPYWLADCNDGRGSSFYNFAYRSDAAADKYFAESLRTLTAIRNVMADGAIFVQLVAFTKPDIYLPRYLANMADAGFTEVRSDLQRQWRTVPRRKWHASLKGRLPSAREVVLFHRAT